MTITLVGVFDTMKEAQQARSRLQKEGVADASIRVEAGTDASATTSTRSTMSTDAQSGDDVDRRDFWDKLFGWMSDDDDDEDRRTSTRHYDEAMRRGNAVLTVGLDDATRAERISDLLNECGAVDVDERVAQWRSTGYAGPAQKPVVASGTGDHDRDRDHDHDSKDDQTLRSIEEQLKVGKQTVKRGRVRIHRSMTERPVEEQVTLHEERVRVERTPVDRAATDADLRGAFKDRNIELTETAEEAVVAKTARVVEEVHVRTDATDRVETVRDTVRKTKIDVEKMDDGPNSSPSGAAVGKAGNGGSSRMPAGSAGSSGSKGSDLGSAADSGNRRGTGAGSLAGSAGAGHRKGAAGYGGAERRHSANPNYHGPERRMVGL
jgi:uncharacterized protein (TIGR02271 family)